tara:strand:+ start:268 stop:1083 length:816 start_codon:yes stop_codon:yes gene_type:complete
MKNLKKISKEIRILILNLIYKASHGHIGGSMSCVDILCALYFGGILNFNKKNYKNKNRDRFFLSKGHATAAIYSTLCKVGMFSENLLYSYSKNNSYFATHTSKKIPGVEFDTGSLGHGLGVASGLAYSAKLKNENFHIFCLISDGELFEGSIWEALIFASNNYLNNLTIIIDNNHQIVMDKTEKNLRLEPIKSKMKSFNFNCYEIDGHNVKKIVETLNKTKISNNKKCNIVICNTVKGKGISFMEKETRWHHAVPTKEEYLSALKELKNEK